jgi:hypothetical protein
MDAKHNYFLDTEFDDQKKPFAVDPISWGLVNEAGREYYGVSREFNRAGRHKFLQEHVIPKLPPVEQCQTIPEIRAGILGFLKPAVELDIWAHNGSTDFFMLYKVWDNQMEFRAALKRTHGIQRVNFREMGELSRLCKGLAMVDQPLPHQANKDAQIERLNYMAYSRWIEKYKPHYAREFGIRLLVPGG